MHKVMFLGYLFYKAVYSRTVTESQFSGSTMYPKARLIQKVTSLVATCLMLSYTPMGLAATEEEILQQLTSFINAKNYVKAFELANENLMDYGGEPKFDYLMGVAAYNIQDYESAVFAFERTVIVKPQEEQGRFYLAKSYFQVDNQIAAKSELIKLKNKSKDPTFIKTLDGYITQVNAAITNKRRKFKQTVALVVGYDSNVNSGTTANDVFIQQLGTTIPLTADSKEIEDTAFNLSYQAVYQEPLSQNSQIIAQLGLFRTDFANTPAFERTMADMTVKYEDKVGDFTYQVGGFFRPMILDKVHYRDQYGWSTNWNLPLNANWATGFQVGFGKVDNRTSIYLDVRDVFATVSARYRSGRWQHVFAANHTDIRSVESNTKHQSYHFYKLDYQTNFVLTASQQLTFSLQWQKLNYDVLHPIFGAVREEDFLNSSVGWRYIMNNWMMLQANYRYSDKSSNVPIFAYSRNEFNLGLTMQF